MRCAALKLVVLSAALYAVSFLFPTQCWWSVFIFLVPLFYGVITQKNSFTFLHGVVWGLVYWGIVLSAVWQFLFWQASSVYAAAMASLFLLGYLSFWSGVWLYCVRISQLAKARSRRTELKHISQTARPDQATKWRVEGYVLVFTTLAYFEFIWRGVLIIFGSWQGMPTSYPLLPLMVHPMLLQLIPHIGTPVLTLCIILFSYCVAHSIAGRYRLITLLGAVITLLPFFVGWFMYQPTPSPTWLDKVVCIIPQKTKGKWAASRAIMHSLQQAYTTYPKAQLFVLPESALPYPLHKDDYVLSMWYDNAVPDAATIICGAAHKQEGNLYNSFFVLHNGRIMHRYDKTSLFPFTENLPNIWRVLLPLHTLFVSDWVPFECGTCQRAPVTLSNGVSIIPYICSELYFAITPAKSQCTIMCLANDNWFRLPYFKTLLLLNAQLTALLWRQDMVYCSYTYQQYINQAGHVAPLPYLER